MKGGTVDFLTKPFLDQEQLDAVVAATERIARGGHASFKNRSAIYS